MPTPAERVARIEAEATGHDLSSSEMAKDSQESQIQNDSEADLDARALKIARNLRITGWTSNQNFDLAYARALHADWMARNDTERLRAENKELRQQLAEKGKRS